MNFIGDDFLLGKKTARRLFHEVAAELPIIDYHNHLPPREVAENHRFRDLAEIWLGGDHYKWRAMRANGIDERFITGDAEPREKFRAWARTVPMTLRNPLHHWTHLELARYFGITDLLDETTADSIWERANERLAAPDFCVQGILERMRVRVICTTDDPTDSLEPHRAYRLIGLAARMLPTFRPDRALAIADGEAWNEWADRLAAVAGTPIAGFADFVNALKTRHDFFHESGGRLSDHGLDACPAADATDEELARIFRRARDGGEVTALDAEKFATRVLLEVGRWNHARGWAMQLHLGPQRNNNSRYLARLGRDAGFDSIGDEPQARRLAWFLDALDRDDRLPRTILYNLNPRDNYVFASMIGNFNDGTVPGKIQFGSGWWFLDQREGIEWQLNALSNLGLLSRFVGMLTDSRSFLSFPRHEYFRRILCNLLGSEAEAGLLPNDFPLLARYVEAISFGNARDYFSFE